jgi:hypothetical protein
MGSIESLNDGQRAVLQLLLRQGKSYDEIAQLLRTDATRVRRRAYDAVDALAPDAGELSDDRRHELADYLLGQQTASQRAAAREFLEGSRAARGWARALAATLAPVAGEDALADIPAEREEVAEALEALDRRAARQEEVQRSSQLGGRLIAAGLGLLLAIAVILVMSLGDDGDDAGNGGAAATTPATSTTATIGGEAQLLAQAELRPPRGSETTASGEAAIVRFPETNRFRLALTARGLPPSRTRGSAYGVWLYTSQRSAQFLGFPDTVVGRDGRLDTVADLSPDTPNYREVLLTLERSRAPTRPGTIVLRGRLVIATQGEAGTPTQTTP